LSTAHFVLKIFALESYYCRKTIENMQFWAQCFRWRGNPKFWMPMFKYWSLGLVLFCPPGAVFEKSKKEPIQNIMAFNGAYALKP